jgi:hypothetical protein
MGTNIESLVDASVIDRATRRHQDALARVTRAEADLSAAIAAHKTAEFTSHLAVQGHGSVLALDAEHALNDASTRLKVARKVRDAAQQSLVAADQGRSMARGQAWAPVYVDGIRQRMAAARKGDEAKRMLAQADAEHAAATASMNLAVQNGTPHIGHWHNGPRLLRSEVEEGGIWRAERVDPDAPAHPWAAYQASQEAAA